MNWLNKTRWYFVNKLAPLLVGKVMQFKKILKS